MQWFGPPQYESVKEVVGPLRAFGMMSDLKTVKASFPTHVSMHVRVHTHTSVATSQESCKFQPHQSS